MCSSDGLAVVRWITKIEYIKTTLEGPGGRQGQWLAGPRMGWIYLVWVEVRVEDNNGVRGVEVDTNTASPRGQKVDEDI